MQIRNVAVKRSHPFLLTEGMRLPELAKNVSLLAILLLTALSPLCKGLFFPREMFGFFTLLSLFAAVYFTAKLVRNEKPVFHTPFVFLHLALVLGYVLSLPAAVYPRGAAGALLQYTMYSVVFLVVFDYFKDYGRKLRTYFILPTVTFGFITAAISLEGYTGAFPALHFTILWGRLGSTLQYHNTAGIYFLLCTLLLPPLMLYSEKLLPRLLLAGMGNTLLLALFFTGSRGTYVISAVAFVLYPLLLPRGSKFRYAGFLACMALPIFTATKGYGASIKIYDAGAATRWIILSVGISMLAALLFSLLLHLLQSTGARIAFASVTAAAVIFAAAYGSMYIVHKSRAVLADIIPQNIWVRLTSIRPDEPNLLARVECYADAVKIIRKHWITGVGGEGFKILYPGVQRTPYTSNLVHNHYLQIFAEAGILAFLSFSGLTLLTLIYFFRARLKVTSPGEKAQAAGLLCAFFVLAAHAAMDFDLSYSGMALIYWCLTGTAAAYTAVCSIFAASVADSVYGDENATGINKSADQVQQDLEKQGIQDVQSSDWYAGSVTVVVDLGIMQSDASGNFNPSGEVTTTEGLAAIAKATGIADLTDSPEQAAAKAQAAGLTAGSNAGSLTRTEVAEILSNALGIPPATQEQVNQMRSTVSGLDALSPHEQAIVTALIQAGIFNPGNTFNGNQVLTRGEMAVLLDRILGGRRS